VLVLVLLLLYVAESGVVDLEPGFVDMEEVEEVEVEGSVDLLRREVSSRRMRIQNAERPISRAKGGSRVLW